MQGAYRASINAPSLALMRLYSVRRTYSLFVSLINPLCPAHHRMVAFADMPLAYLRLYVKGEMVMNVNLHKTICVVWHNIDYALDVMITRIGNNGIGPYDFGGGGYDHGVDYAEDWDIKRVMDADGQPVPDEEAAPIIDQMYDDVSLVEDIQSKLDEAVHEQRAEDGE